MKFKTKTATVTLPAFAPKLVVLIFGIVTCLSLLAELFLFLVFPSYFDLIVVLSWAGISLLFFTIGLIVYFTITSFIQKRKPILEFVDPEYDPSDNSLIVKFHVNNSGQLLSWKGFITITCNDQVVVKRAKFDFATVDQGLISQVSRFPLFPDTFLTGNNVIKSFDVAVDLTNLRIISGSIELFI
jgi:hypothetical protein